MLARGEGNILNVASVYAFGPVPYQSVYAASKAFLLSFSAALGDELRDSGIGVTVFCPGVTQTAFRSRAGIFEKSARSGMTAAAAARIGYAAMKRGRHIVVPGLPNRLFALLARMLPVRTFAALARAINRTRGVNQ
jgi:short-subunit dehydrogenase